MEPSISLIETEQITPKIELILRQTDYTVEQATEQLKQHNFNEINVIKAYLGIVEKKPQQKTLNQQIYTQLRSRLDSNMRNYHERVEKGEAKKL